MDKAIVKHLEKRGVFVTKVKKSFSERNNDFFKWFEEDVLGFDSEEYHREFWREAYKKGHTIGHIPQTLRNHYNNYNPRMLGGVLFIELVLAGGALAVWLIRREIDRHVQRLRRPTYYEIERSRRQALTQERRKILQRTTINSKPQADTLLEAFANAKSSPEDMIRFGSLIEDLECYVDNSPYFKEGRLVGRRGGIRRYLELEVPELFAKYKTVMKYKAISKKFRQAVGVSDPIPAAAVLENKKTVENQSKEAPNTAIEQDKGIESGCRELISEEIRKARKVAKGILKSCEGSQVSLLAQLTVRLGVDYVPMEQNVLSKQNVSEKQDGVLSKQSGALSK